MYGGIGVEQLAIGRELLGCMEVEEAIHKERIARQTHQSPNVERPLRQGSFRGLCRMVEEGDVSPLAQVITPTMLLIIHTERQTNAIAPAAHQDAVARQQGLLHSTGGDIAAGGHTTSQQKHHSQDPESPGHPSPELPSFRRICRGHVR